MSCPFTHQHADGKDERGRKLLNIDHLGIYKMGFNIQRQKRGL
jgi:hypothetical protein